jgi:hypothetical protein
LALTCLSCGVVIVTSATTLIAGHQNLLVFELGLIAGAGAVIVGGAAAWMLLRGKFREQPAAPERLPGESGFLIR